MQIEAAALKTGVETKEGVNPIRKVVTMLQMMQNKVEAEGKKMKELFDKYMCYCETADETLAKSIQEAETKIPQLESDIKEAIELEKTLAADIENAQNTRAEAKEAIAKAESIRNKEGTAFA